MRVGLLLCLALFSNLSLAAPAASLAQLTEQVQSVTALAGTFQQQKTIALLPLPLQSSGRFSYNREQGLRWQTELPFANTLQITPEQEVQLYDADGKLSSSRNAPAVAGLFTDLLLGRFDQLAQHFEVLYQQQPDAWVVTLTPSNDAVAASLQSIQLSGAEQYIQTVDIVESNGDRSLIQLNHTTP